MLKYFRYYAWMTDIVPAILAVSNIIAPVKFKQEIISHLKPWYGLTVSQTWEVAYIITILLMIPLIVMEIRSNYDWIRCEQKKSFNFGTLIFTAVLWNPYIFLFRGLLQSSLLTLIYSLAIALPPIMLQAVLEYARPFCPKQPVSEEIITASALNIEPGETFYYRETRMFPDAFLCSYVFLASLMIMSKWWPYNVVIASLLFIATIIRRTTSLVMNNDYVALKGYGVRYKISVADIENCGVYEYTPQERESKPISISRSRPDRFTFVPGGMEGRCLKIVTKDGKTVIIGMKKPLTACKLIQSALAAHRDIA